MRFVLVARRYGELSGKSNTMLFAERPGDINALLAQAATVMASVPGATGGAGAGLPAVAAGAAVAPPTSRPASPSSE